MLTIFRAIFLVTATLCLVDAALVTASVFLADHAPDAARIMPLSLAVSGAFLAVGLLILGVQFRLAALARLVPPARDDARRHLFLLQLWLACLGAGLCILLAGLTYGIIERIGHGFAVFG